MTRAKVYAEAMRLSRNFNNRSLKETKELYQTIQKAVRLAQKGNGKSKSSKESIDFLIRVYEPYFKKIAGKFFVYVEHVMMFEDVLQETYVLFMVLLYRYDETISSFSYYLRALLPQHVHVWVQKVISSSFLQIDMKSIENSLGHPNLDAEDKVYDYFNARILEDEYTEFILKRSEKSSRSNTVREVCLKIFLGKKTCSELANELGITYHAVYEIINKIKRELRVFFSESKFSEFVLSSTGREYLS